MPNDYGQRGQAAMRLLKGGKKGAPPPEDDLGLPPEEGAPPDDGSGAPPMDLAAMLSGGGAPPGAPPGGDGMPPMPTDGGMGTQDPSQDLDAALGSVESSLDGLPPEAAEEIRGHLNAIKEIAAGGGGKQEEAMDGPPTPDGASMPTPTAPAKEEMAG